MSENDPVLELRVVLTVDDHDQAVRFFRDALGLRQVREFGEREEKGVLLSAGRAVLEVVSRKQAEQIDRIEVGRPIAGPVQLALEVDDVEGIGERLAASGAAYLSDPVTAPWGHRSVRLSGPQGIQITLFAVLPS